MTKTPSYDDDDFEPFCNWRREKGCDTLVVHLPKFKNEELKVQVITNSRVLKITGERALNASKRSQCCQEVKVDASKRSRFSKEVPISDKCNVYDIHAKFVKGILTVVMSKPVPQTDQNPNGKTCPDDKMTKLPTCNCKCCLPSENEAATGKTATNRVSTRKSCSKEEKSFTCWRLCCL